MHADGSDARLWFAATERNREAIAAVLEPLLPHQGLVLEIASGSGEHLSYFQQRFAASHPQLRWQGSDPVLEHRSSLVAWARVLGLQAMEPPLALDATVGPWPRLNPALMLCINMIHIAPWQACEGLMAEAASQLAPGALLVLYGPFLEADVATSPSNEAFDASLRSRDSRWGLRQLEQVGALAASHGLAPAGRWPMPANNLTVAFRRLG
ncbi:MAG: DUF938 domain-containing protein [Synechococcus sp.]|nr:DUF938 domain-containing protein [Synechococcus sp.]